MAMAVSVKRPRIELGALCSWTSERCTQLMRLRLSVPASFSRTFCLLRVHFNI
jgi:hypothetical protein